MMDSVTEEKMIFAEEALIGDVQFAIHNLLIAKGMSRADLARALEVSEARISQLFSENPKNLTLRTIAKVFCAAGDRARITSDELEKIFAQAKETQARSVRPAKAFDALHTSKRNNVWRQESNDNSNVCELFDVAA